MTDSPQQFLEQVKKHKFLLFALVGLGLLFYAFPILLVLLFGIPDMIAHNIQLDRFSRLVYTYPLPDHTQVISKERELGILTGNSNHCDYYVEQVLASDLTRDEIVSYYHNLTVPGEGSGTPINEDGGSDGIYLSDGVYVGFLKKALLSGKTVFKMSVFHFGDDPGLDFRCH